jgi:hypothetical protein
MAETPDVIAALITHTLANGADVTALCGDRVSASTARFGAMPRHAVLFRVAGGIQGEAGLFRRRVDASCYGSTEYEAMRLARTLEAFLCRPARDAAVSFTAAGAVVHDVALEGGPNLIPDADTAWPRAFSTFSVLVHGVGA